MRKIYVVCVAGILYHDKRKKSIIILKTHKQTILSVLCHLERSATRWSAVELLRVEQSEQAKARSEATQGSARDNSELLECECYFYISSAEIRPLTAVALRVSTPLHYVPLKQVVSICQGAKHRRMTTRREGSK